MKLLLLIALSASATTVIYDIYDDIDYERINVYDLTEEPNLNPCFYYDI